MEAELIELGFSKNEAKAYLALLELGDAGAAKVAQHAGMHRPNAYEALQRLARKGLASTLQRGGTQLFAASDPQNLVLAMRERAQRAQELIPQLKARSIIAAHEGTAEILKGVPAFISALHACLEQKAPIKVYGIPKEAVEMMRTQIPHFHTARIRRKVLMQHIYNYDAPERIRYLNTLPKTQARFIDDAFRSTTSTLVCGSVVLITHWEVPVFTVRIAHRHIAESYLHYFDILWKGAKLP